MNSIGKNTYRNNVQNSNVTKLNLKVNSRAVDIEPQWLLGPFQECNVINSRLKEDQDYFYIFILISRANIFTNMTIIRDHACHVHDDVEFRNDFGSRTQIDPNFTCLTYVFNLRGIFIKF